MPTNTTLYAFSCDLSGYGGSASADGTATFTMPTKATAGDSTTTTFKTPALPLSAAEAQKLASADTFTLTALALTAKDSSGAVPTPSVVPTAAPLAASTPMRIEIPSLNVSAPVMQLGLGADGSVQVPPLSNHNLAGWYRNSVTPGERGSSIILGHVDPYTGESVFFNIKNLHLGDQIKVVRADGTTATFAVDGVQKVVKSTFPTEAIYGNASYPSLRLVTCAGPFDSAKGQYLDNIVVYSHLV